MNVSVLEMKGRKVGPFSDLSNGDVNMVNNDVFDNIGTFLYVVG